MLWRHAEHGANHEFLYQIIACPISDADRYSDSADSCASFGNSGGGRNQQGTREQENWQASRDYVEAAAQYVQPGQDLRREPRRESGEQSGRNASRRSRNSGSGGVSREHRA